MGRCDRCGKEGTGSGTCSSCISHQTFVNTHMQIVEDLRPQVAETNEACTRLCCNMCGWLCTTIGDCLGGLCTKNSDDESAKQSLLPANQRTGTADEINAQVIRSYSILYNKGDRNLLRSFLGNTMPDNYESTWEGQPLSKNRGDVETGVMKAHEKGQKMVNLEIQQSSPDVVRFSFTVRFLNGYPDSKCYAMARFSYPGFWIGTAYSRNPL